MRRSGHKMPIDDALDEINRREELERDLESRKDAQLELAMQREIEADLKKQLEIYDDRLKNASSDLQDQIIKSHLKGLLNFWPGHPKDKIDEAVIRLVTSEDFPEIYKNALILKTPVSRFEYILMKGLQKKIVDMISDRTKFFSRLAPLGLGIVCPYFECNRNLLGYAPDQLEDKCLIDGKEYPSLCEGKYYTCALFKDRTTKFAIGELPIIEPKSKYNHPELIIPGNEKDRLERDLLDEIETYWRGRD